MWWFIVSNWRIIIYTNYRLKFSWLVITYSLNTKSQKKYIVYFRIIWYLSDFFTYVSILKLILFSKNTTIVYFAIIFVSIVNNFLFKLTYFFEVSWRYYQFFILNHVLLYEHCFIKLLLGTIFNIIFFITIIYLKICLYTNIY